MNFQLRENFGPLPGRKWISIDYSNIELRIWGYLCGNKEFISAFENDISVHLVIARELHPQCSGLSDDEFQKTREYKTTKNGDFSIIYGSSPAVADATYGIKGAYRKLSMRFPEVRDFTEHLHTQVREKGYVETLTGYRLWIPLEDPHKAVSGRVQGTAGSIIGRAMISCNDWLRTYRPDTQLILQVHDELVFDAPLEFPHRDISYLCKLMSRQGDSISIPLPVKAEVHMDHWAKGERVA